MKAKMTKQTQDVLEARLRLAEAQLHVALCTNRDLRLRLNELEDQTATIARQDEEIQKLKARRAIRRKTITG